MGHSYNNGLHTTSKGITIDAVRIVDLDSATPTVEEDCKSGLIESVSRAVAGVYVLQLSQPYPPKMVVCLPGVSQANGTTDILHAQVDQDGYDASAGTLTIYTMNDDDSGAPALLSGAANQELHVIMMFNRYTN